jgi:hypothetical protein
LEPLAARANFHHVSFLRNQDRWRAEQLSQEDGHKTRECKGVKEDRSGESDKGKSLKIPHFANELGWRNSVQSWSRAHPAGSPLFPAQSCAAKHQTNTQRLKNEGCLGRRWDLFFWTDMVKSSMLTEATHPGARSLGFS